MAYPISLNELVYNWIYEKNHRKNSRLLTRGIDDTSNAGNVVATFVGDDTSDPNASGEEIYSDPKNLPTAVASLLNHVQDLADFHPAAETNEVVAQQYNEYIRQIDGTPFFALEYSDDIQQDFYTSDYNVLIDQVISLYEGMAVNDIGTIESALEDMVTSVFSQQQSEAWLNLFSQTTVDLNTYEGEPQLYIVYTKLYMFYDQSGKHEVSQQSYQVKRTRYKVLDQLIHTYAEDLAALDESSINDWINGGSTPQAEGSKSRANRFCFKRRRSTKFIKKDKRAKFIK